ncbi:hypothetical protein BJ742DRAFT_317935 [Cladochytrium replicatum]|nr:hypothetical protein BJ742DRAFT_317935 [Cladochytrium replicatum]
MDYNEVLVSESMTSAGALFALFAVTISFWENLEKMRNKPLLVSVLLFVTSSSLSISINIAAAYMEQIAQPHSAKVAYVLSAVFWALAWASLTFHSATRTILIAFPRLQNHSVWFISGSTVFAQLCLTGTGAYFYSKSQIDTLGKVYDPRGVTVLLVEIPWYSIVESVLFITAQYKIVSAVNELRDTQSGDRQAQAPARRWSVWSSHTNSWTARHAKLIYVKGLIRSMLYCTNIIMTFLSVGGFFNHFAGKKSRVGL